MATMTTMTTKRRLNRSICNTSTAETDPGTDSISSTFHPTPDIDTQPSRIRRTPTPRTARVETAARMMTVTHFFMSCCIRILGLLVLFVSASSCQCQCCQAFVLSKTNININKNNNNNNNAYRNRNYNPSFPTSPPTSSSSSSSSVLSKTISKSLRPLLFVSHSSDDNRDENTLKEDDNQSVITYTPTTTTTTINVRDLKDAVFQLYDTGKVEAAMKLLEEFAVARKDSNLSNSVHTHERNDTDSSTEEVSKVFRNLLREIMISGGIDTDGRTTNNGHNNNDNYKIKSILKWASRMVMEDVLSLPNANTVLAVMQAWTMPSPTVAGASLECKALIDKLWFLFHQQNHQWTTQQQQQQHQQNQSTSDDGSHDDHDRREKQKQLHLQRFVPDREMYFVAIRACSLRDRGVDAAKRAEALMEQMETLSATTTTTNTGEFPELTPDRSIVNEVMNAWSKSGLSYRAGKRCETLLNRMITTAQNEKGRWRLAPDTISFNIAIAALAQGKDRDSGSRAEALLFKMEELHSSRGWDCAPDRISFNSVINNWASSRSPGAAQRATEIVDHMIKRYEAGVSAVLPDDVTYSVRLKALSKSRDEDAIFQAEDLFQEYREAVEERKWGMTHSALTWNSMINCFAKSRRPDSGRKARDLFDTMKENADTPGWERCAVDTYTYTSLIDAIAKAESYEASEEAIELLEEIEERYAQTGNQLLELNILLYTTVVNAIGRSHKDPDRAQKIVDRVETAYLKSVEQGGRRPPKPDVLFYNALINAYGWSDMSGRSQRSFAVLQHMMELHRSGDLRDARPDVISYNSVLNACAHERASSQAERDGVMKIVTRLYEDLTSRQNGPNKSTYTQVLIAISNHMPPTDGKKALMGEAVFFQCAEDGLVHPKIIFAIEKILPKHKFQEIMGEALNREFHNSGTLRFDLAKLPWQWTTNAKDNTRHPFSSTASRKRRNGYEVTKNNLWKVPNTKAYR